MSEQEDHGTGAAARSAIEGIAASAPTLFGSTRTDAAGVPRIRLGNGVEIPQLGLGVWQVGDDAATERLVRYAIDEAGYRFIDGAKGYGNEVGVGAGVRDASVDRGELFISTKIANEDHGYREALTAAEESLRRLGTDYLDLLLIHWPRLEAGRFLDTWRALEALYADGKARAIGVCNNKPHHLQLLLDHGDVVPAVNQIELHPHLPQYATQAFDRAHGIATESWSPLGGTSRGGWFGQGKENTLLGNEVIARIADEHGKTPAQVILRWHLENGLITFPKSTHPERIRQNIDVFDFALTGEDHEDIARLDTGERVGFDPDRFDEQRRAALG